jgi:hypothetical protein
LGLLPADFFSYLMQMAFSEIVFLSKVRIFTKKRVSIIGKGQTLSIEYAFHPAIFE